MTDKTMIAAAIIDEIRDLLAEGKDSQREIAIQTSVSQGTVNKLARGKRPDYTIRKQLSVVLTPPSGPPVRCPGCGGMVKMPCLLCHMRSL